MCIILTVESRIFLWAWQSKMRATHALIQVFTSFGKKDNLQHSCLGMGLSSHCFVPWRGGASMLGFTKQL